MTDRLLSERPKNDQHAAKTLSDGAYLAYALCQAMKLLQALLRKRWPEVG